MHKEKIVHAVFATKAIVQVTRSTPLTENVVVITASVFVRANGVTAAVKTVPAVAARTSVPRENASLVDVKSQTCQQKASSSLGSWETPPTEAAEVLSDIRAMYSMETAVTKTAYADRFHGIVEMDGKSTYGLPNLCKYD